MQMQNEENGMRSVIPRSAKSKAQMIWQQANIDTIEEVNEKKNVKQNFQFGPRPRQKLSTGQSQFKPVRKLFPYQASPSGTIRRTGQASLVGHHATSHV